MKLFVKIILISNQDSIGCKCDPLEDHLPVLDLAIDQDEDADQKSGKSSEGVSGVTRGVALA